MTWHLEPRSYLLERVPPEGSLRMEAKSGPEPRSTHLVDLGHAVKVVLMVPPKHVECLMHDFK